jgi:WD40 repeat protein
MEDYTLANHKVATPSIAIAPDGSMLVTGTEEGNVYLHSLPDGTILRLLERQPGFVNQIVFSPDGKVLALCSTDIDSQEGTAHLWHTSNWTLLAKLDNDDIGGGESLAFTTDNAHIVVGHADGFTRIWRLSDLTIQHTFQDISEIPKLAVDNKNAALAVSNNETVRVWRLEDMTLLRTFVNEEKVNFVVDMAFSPNGTYLAVAGMYGPIHLWNMKTGTLVCQLLDEYSAHAIGFSPNGQVLACGCEDGHIRVVKIPDGILQRTISAHDGWVRDLQFTPDGLALVSSGSDGAVRLWQELGE